MQRLEPAPGVSIEQQEAWEELIELAFYSTEFVLNNGTPGRDSAWRRGTGARIKLLALDPVALTPAYINSVIGRDLERPESVACIAAVIQHWQTRILYSPSFYFEPKCDDSDPTAVAYRQRLLELWFSWWEGKDYDVAVREHGQRLARSFSREVPAEFPAP